MMHCAGKKTAESAARVRVSKPEGFRDYTQDWAAGVWFSRRDKVEIGNSGLVAAPVRLQSRPGSAAELPWVRSPAVERSTEPRGSGLAFSKSGFATGGEKSLLSLVACRGNANDSGGETETAGGEM